MKRAPIFYKGMWRYVGRTDLAGQVQSRHAWAGSNNEHVDPKLYMESIAYGVIVTDNSFAVEDSTTDG